MKHLEKATNIAIILGVAVFIFSALRGSSPTPIKSPPAAPSSLLDKTINLPGEAFPRTKNTLLMVMSTTCHYCAESLPFYKSLAMAVKDKAETVAVLPQPLDEAKSYLNAAGIRVDSVISLRLQAVGVFGTPTLLLLDPKGKVISEWDGLISSNEEKAMLSQMETLIARKSNAAPTGHIGE